MQHQIPLLRTKLHRPSVPMDHVNRPRLLERLEQDQRRPAVLVSAPAGYGKSTLVASWLQRYKRPAAWLSLDENDNDLQRFLSYFVEAVQSIFPVALDDTRALIDAPSLPPIPVLAPTLINDLDRIVQDFIVVLDDIHCISDQAVQGLLKLVLHDPPKSMQLVLVGRRDPVLPIAALRAKGLLTELRMRDLCFTDDEAAAFLQTTIGPNLEASDVAALAKQSEGWVTSLRLTAVAMSGQENPDRKLLGLKGTTRYVADYLLSEVLERQPEEMRELLLHSAVFDRFCAPLCDAVIEIGGASMNRGFDGRTLIEWLHAGSLFIIPLDDENRWFRYHHLFREFLLSQLKHLASTEAISSLNGRASTWCEAQGLLEESIDYALSAGDAEAAADIVERHQDAEFAANHWFIVDRWLKMLPDEIRQHRPRLLLAEARVLNDRFRPMDVPPVIERARALINDRPTDPVVRGELFHFLSFISFWQGDGTSSQALQKQALELVPDNHTGYLRAQLELYVALTSHINGHKEEALGTLRKSIDSRHLRSGYLWERLQFGLATIHLLAGELSAAHHAACILLDDAVRSQQYFVESWAAYLLGLVTFHRGEMTEACHHFGRVVKQCYIANSRAAVDSMASLAIIHQLDGQADMAEGFLRQAEDYAGWTQDPFVLEVVFSARARVALLRGDIGAALRWQRGFSMPLQTPATFIFLVNPWITECRVLLATGAEADRAKAEAKLKLLLKEARALHFTCQTMDILALQLLAAEQGGERDQAIDRIEHLLAQALPEEWIRPFLEIGTPMVELLHRLPPSHAVNMKQVGKILVALHQPRSPSPTMKSLREPLTWREQEILNLLAKRLQNKEISAQLNISPDTVKSHLRNIYHKLDVSKRREAVVRAEELGLIS